MQTTQQTYRGVVTGVVRGVDEAALCAHFARYGDDVRVQLRRNRDGASYGFGTLRLRTTAPQVAALCVSEHVIADARVRVQDMASCSDDEMAPQQSTHLATPTPPPPPPHVSAGACGDLYLCYPLRHGADHALIARRDAAHGDCLVVVDRVAPPALAPRGS